MDTIDEAQQRLPMAATEILYEYGQRPAPNKPLKERVYGNVSTKGVRVLDHVNKIDGKVYFDASSPERPPTAWQVHEIARVSRKGDGSTRTHYLYDVMYMGVYYSRARSWADVQRKLGVDLPKVRACRIMTAAVEERVPKVSSC